MHEFVCLAHQVEECFVLLVDERNLCVEFVGEGEGVGGRLLRLDDRRRRLRCLRSGCLCGRFGRRSRRSGFFLRRLSFDVFFDFFRGFGCFRGRCFVLAAFGSRRGNTGLLLRGCALLRHFFCRGGERFCRLKRWFFFSTACFHIPISSGCCLTFLGYFARCFSRLGGFLGMRCFRCSRFLCRPRLRLDGGGLCLPQCAANQHVAR